MLPHAVQPCARQESKHSLRQTQHTLLYTLCLLILAYIWVERGEEIRQEPPHVKTDLVYIWLCYYFSFQKYCLDSLHSDRCELRIWAKYDSSCCSFWKGQSHNSLLSSPSLNSCFRTVLLFTLATTHLLFLIFIQCFLQILNSQEHKVHRTSWQLWPASICFCLRTLAVIKYLNEHLYQFGLGTQLGIGLYHLKK